MRCAGCCRRFAAWDWDAAIDPPADARGYLLSRASPLKIFRAGGCIALAELAQILRRTDREIWGQIQRERRRTGESAAVPDTSFCSSARFVRSAGPKARRQAAISALAGDRPDVTSEAIARRTDGRGEALIIAPLVSTRVLAPKGSNMSAQGRAQRRPGSWFPIMQQPCKGGTNNMAAVCLALSGRRCSLATFPPGGASTAVAAALCPGLTCWAPSGRTIAR